MQLRTAKRAKAKLKIGISSPSGNGKTYSSLLLAKGLVGDWSKVAVIDTENGSASMYDHLGQFQVLDLTAPYSPEKYIEAIKACEKAGMECVIIDSASHEWSGPGGCLEIHSQLGGRFDHWAKVTPRHKSFIDAILQTPMHFIVTSRTKVEWSLEKNDRGKTEPSKVGLKAEQREGLEYELTVAFRLNPNHLVSTEKDRTGLFTGKPEFVISEKTGEMLRDWMESGKEPEPAQVIAVSPRVESMLKAFSDFGVTKGMLEARAKGPITETHLDEFRAIYDQISHGVDASKFFPVPGKAAGASDLNQRLKAGKQ